MTTKSRKQQIEEMLATDPKDPFLRYALAMEHVSAKDDEAAAGCFRELLAAAPDYVPAYLMAGQVLIRLGRANEARDVLVRGMAAALQKGDRHAHDEMQGFLAGME